MAARIAALAAAVAMIVGALAVRDRMDNPPAGGSSSGGRSGELSLVCATELRRVCETLEANGGVRVTVEPAAVTAARLQSVEPDAADIDGWLAVGPWPEMVDIVRRQANRPRLFQPKLDRRARSPLVLVAFNDDLERLKTGSCQGEVGSKCVGDAAVGGAFRISAPDSADATGLLAEAAFAGALIGNPDFATNDLDDPAVSSWVGQLDRSIDQARRDGAGSLSDLLIKRGIVKGFVTTEADATPTLAGAAVRSQVGTLPLNPPATADVIAGVLTGSRGDKVRALLATDRTRDALLQAGWATGAKSPAGTPLADDDGLPSAGVLEALEGTVK